MCCFTHLHFPVVQYCYKYQNVGSLGLQLTRLVVDQKNVSQEWHSGRSWKLQDKENSPEPTGQEVAREP
jgi:hypothetical protein